MMMLIWANDVKKTLLLCLQVDSTVRRRAWTQMMMEVQCMLGLLSGVGHMQMWGFTIQTLKRRIKVKVDVCLQLRCWESGEHIHWLLL